MGWVIQIVIGFIVWFVLAWIYAEGSNPFKPTWMNNLSSFIGGTCKVLLFLMLVLGLSGLTSSGKK